MTTLWQLFNIDLTAFTKNHHAEITIINSDNDLNITEDIVNGDLNTHHYIVKSLIPDHKLGLLIYVEELEVIRHD